jgi:hypothetical protein
MENKAFMYEISSTTYKVGEVMMPIDRDKAAPLLHQAPYRFIGLEGKDFQDIYTQLERKLKLRDRESHAVLAFTLADDLNNESITFAGWKFALELMSKRSIVVWSAVKGDKYSIKIQLHNK